MTRVVCHEPVHRVAHNTSQAEALRRCRLQQFLAKQECYAANEANRQFWTSVGTDISLKEKIELFEDNISYTLLLTILNCKGGETCEIAICGFFTIGSPQSFVDARMWVHLAEIFKQAARHLSFQIVGKHAAPKDGATPLVAKYIAKRRNAGNQLPTLEQPAVGTCPEYAGYAVGIAKQGKLGSDEVGRHANVSRKVLCEKSRHALGTLTAASGTIEVHALSPAPLFTSNILRENRTYLIVVESVGIQAAPYEAHLALVCKQHPRRLRAASVGYDYPYSFFHCVGIIP